MFRGRRRLGTILVVLGVAVLGYAAAVLFWRDPVTDLYQRWQQDRLASQLETSFREYRIALELPEQQSGPSDRTDAVADMAAAPTRDPEADVRKAARRLATTLRLGQPVGRIVIAKLDLRSVFVHGTRWGPDLTRGPGHYEKTSLPGLGKVTAIAGHRTTFGAPFRHIDDLVPGDTIELELRYGVFRYRVIGHEIVSSDDWRIIRERGFDMLVLSACHPLFSSERRWIVYARLAEVEMVGGSTYTVAEGQRLAARASG